MYVTLYTYTYIYIRHATKLMYFYIRCVFVFFEVLGMSDAELPAFVPKKTSMAAVSHSEMKGRLVVGLSYYPKFFKATQKKRTGGTTLPETPKNDGFQ